jgi:hypothetical protein
MAGACPSRARLFKQALDMSVGARDKAWRRSGFDLSFQRAPRRLMDRKHAIRDLRLIRQCFLCKKGMDFLCRTVLAGRLGFEMIDSLAHHQAT